MSITTRGRVRRHETSAGSPTGSRGVALEVVTALVPAVMLPAVVAAALSIGAGRDFDPLVREHQISALAGLALATMGVLALALAVSAVAERRHPGARDLAWSLAPAFLAGVASGLWAAGAVAALDGTPWSFNGDGGDAGRYIEWAVDPSARPTTYPPGGIWLLRGMAALTGTEPAFALKPLTVGVMAITGPACYFAWRLVAGRVFALVVGITMALPTWDAYLPTRRLTLFLVLPVAVALLDRLIADVRPDPRRVATEAAVLAGLSAAIVTVYSGWTYFLSLAGVAAAWLIVRRLQADDGPGRVQRARILGLSVAAAAAVGAFYVVPVLATPGASPTSLVDTFQGSINQALASSPSAFLPSVVGLPTVVVAAAFAVLVVRSERTTLDVMLAAGLLSAVIFRLVLLFRFGVTGNPGLFQRTGPVLHYLSAVAVVRATVVVLAAAARRVPLLSTPVVAVRGARALVAAVAVLIVVDVPVLVGGLMPAESGQGRLTTVAHSLVTER